MHKNIVDTQAELSTAEREAEAAKENLSRAKRLADAAETSQKSAQDESKSLKKKYDAAQTAISASNKEVKRLENEADRLEKELPGKQLKLSQAEGKLKQEQSNLDKANKKMDAAKQQANEARNSETKARETTKELQDQISNIRCHRDGSKPFCDYNYVEYEDEAVKEAKQELDRNILLRPGLFSFGSSTPELEREISYWQSTYDRRLARLNAQKPKVSAPHIEPSLQCAVICILQNCSGVMLREQDSFLTLQYEKLTKELKDLGRTNYVKQRGKAETAEQEASNIVIQAQQAANSAREAAEQRKTELSEATNHVETLKAQATSAKIALETNTNRQRMEQDRDEAKRMYDQAQTKVRESGAELKKAVDTRRQSEQEVTSKTQRSEELMTQMGRLNVTHGLRNDKLAQVMETEKEEESAANSLEAKYETSSKQLEQVDRKHREVAGAFAKRKDLHRNLTETWESANTAFKIAKEEFDAMQKEVEELKAEHRDVKDHLSIQKAQAEPGSRTFQSGGGRTPRRVNGVVSPKRPLRAPPKKQVSFTADL